MTPNIRPSATTHQAHHPHDANPHTLPTTPGLTPAEPATLRKEGVV